MMCVLTTTEQQNIVASVAVPEIRSAVAQTLAGLSGVENAQEQRGHRLTLLSLLTFHRKHESALSVETNNNILKSRLMESGVLYFGPLFSSASEATKSQRLATFATLGLRVEHLAFLNAEQVELFHVYLSETGLVANP